MRQLVIEGMWVLGWPSNSWAPCNCTKDCSNCPEPIPLTFLNFRIARVGFNMWFKHSTLENKQFLFQTTTTPTIRNRQRQCLHL